MEKENKNAVITGANSGIGLALANKLLAEGYNVFGTSRSGKIDEIRHDNLKVIHLDITDRNSVRSAINEINLSASIIDLLINNAGVAPDVFAVEPEVSTISDTFSTNVLGTMNFTEAMLPLLSFGAKVIFVSSNMSLSGNIGTNGPGYRMSKAAVNVYAMMLAQRLAYKNIHVTPIHPGWVQTRLGGDQAPFTTAQSADGIFEAIQKNQDNGKFWNVAIGGIEAY